MRVQLDPDGVEPRALTEAVALADSRLLEIGTGDGRLARRLADVPGRTVAVDASVAEVLPAALEALEAGGTRDLRLLPASGTDLPFRDRTFDGVLLAWSL